MPPMLKAGGRVKRASGGSANQGPQKEAVPGRKETLTVDPRGPLGTALIKAKARGAYPGIKWTDEERASGGRVAISGKTNPSFTAKKVDTRGSASTAEGAGIGKGRTPVQHAPQKDELKQVGRKAVITKATSGPISGEKGPMAPHAKGGAMGGLAKLDKAHHPRKYTKA